MTRSTEPLSPEERALAERLARADVRREPAPALDAAILAAARAAVDGNAAPIVTATAARTAASAPSTGAPSTSTPSSIQSSTVVPMPTRKPMARWPLGLSVAASLVLAAGIGWRLADGGGSESALDSAAPQAKSEPAVYASADAAAPAEEATQAVILEPDINRVPPPPPPPPLEAAAERRAMAVESPQALEQKAKRLDDDKDRQDHFEMDEGVAQDAISENAAIGDSTAFPAEPPARTNASSENAAPAAKPTVAGSSAPESFAGGARDKRETAKSDREEELGRAQVARSRQTAPAAPPPPASVVAAPAPAFGATADQPFDDQPPVSADSPQFRQAWLQRIRDLLARGQVDAGRNSLQEFRRRYPDAELPEDLKKIAATLPPP